MKLFLVQAFVIFLVVVVIMSVFFRNERAANMLNFALKVGLAYVAAIFLLGILRGLGYW